jgi:hypothetical protein
MSGLPGMWLKQTKNNILAAFQILFFLQIFAACGGGISGE